MKTGSFYISREDTIHDIQDRFSQLFPRLTISFYTQNCGKSSENSCVMFSPDCHVRELNPQCKYGSIQITEQMMAYEMEDAILHNFGLHAEIRERMGDHEILKVHISKWLFHEKYPELKYLFSQRAAVSFQEIPFGC